MPPSSLPAIAAIQSDWCAAVGYPNGCSSALYPPLRWHIVSTIRTLYNACLRPGLTDFLQVLLLPWPHHASSHTHCGEMLHGIVRCSCAIQRFTCPAEQSAHIVFKAYDPHASPVRPAQS